MIVDAAILAFVGFFTWRGVRRGLLSSLAGLAGFVAATAAAVLLYRPAGSVLHAVLRLSFTTAYIAGALLVFVGVSFAAWFAGRALTRAMRLTKWGALNAAGGGALAGVWAVSWVTVLLLALTVIPTPRAVGAELQHSTLARGLVREGPRFASRTVWSGLAHLFDSMSSGRGDTVAIAATNDYREVSADEGALFHLANTERARRGLRPLRWNARLGAAALEHASDMYRRGYFGHVSPGGETPGDRLRAHGVRFAEAGENIALAPDARAAHARLMRSSQHRTHILSKRFDYVGVGVVYGPRGIVVVQEFATIVASR
jgi:uncharacterized membrane protein required for colicin V production